jgi:hypothetical protein
MQCQMIDERSLSLNLQLLKDKTALRAFHLHSLFISQQACVAHMCLRLEHLDSRLYNNERWKYVI